MSLCDCLRSHCRRKAFLPTIIFAGCLVAVSSLSAQTLAGRRYTSSDGLVSDRVTCITQDEKGFMWLGTYFGISRYDGYRFTTIALPAVQQNKYVSALAAAGGNMYAGFWLGGGLMEYSRGKAKAYEIPREKNSSNDVTALCPHNHSGVLVASGNNNIYHFANGRFHLLFTLDNQFETGGIRSLSMDKEGNIWVGTMKGLVLHGAGKSRVLFTGKNIVHVRKAANGMMVIGGSGFDYFVAHTRITGDSFEVPDTLWHSKESVPVYQNSFNEGNCWMADSSSRFFHIAPGTKTTVSSTEKANIDDIHFFYADRENNLWIATHTGVVKMANLPARSYAFSEKAYNLGDITGTDSLLWVSNSQFLYVIKNGMMTKQANFAANDRIGRLLQNDNHLWVSLEKEGLWRLDLTNDRIISQRYFDIFKGKKIRVHGLTEDAAGNIWACGQNGIFLIRNGNITGHFLPGTKKTLIVCIAVDAKNRVIWAGDNEAGVYKIRYQINGDNISYETEAQVSAAQGLTDGHVRSLLLDSKGTLWCGTRFGGIFRIGEKDGKPQVENLSVNANLQCARVTDIYEEKGKAIWIATCNGIYRYLYHSGQWQGFSTAHGLLASEIYTHYVSASAGINWAVSASGVTELHFEKTASMPIPLINITRITVMGKIDTAALYNGEPPSWRAGEGSVAFQFIAASYTDEKRIWYKYRLKGHDKDWSAATQDNSVNYASLPPGNYTFEVVASRGDGKWSTSAASFHFTLVQPFYKSPWFIILLLASGFAAFYFFRMYRLRQRLELERLRSRISADLHDDIGSTLSSISIISEGVMQETNPIASREMVREISENSLLLMDKMDDIIWCVNPQNDSFQHLLLRIRKFAAGLLEAKGIEYDITIDERIPDSVLSMNNRQHLYLILKEAINNLVKYSGASYAGISVQLKAGYLMIAVTDNGRGFNLQAEQQGNGLRNMKQRAARMKAELVIQSSPAGTRVLLKTKIK